ncbi:molybdopterin-dependent oxidoreductase [Paenibacillus sp. GCM10023252]|uniref:molybdopterin-containing oxidoreductase family protein n=1 Tax=Paenibacillus sp. GCM10023252 TaxID=3252649 RepID=UPI0036221428
MNTHTTTAPTPVKTTLRSVCPFDCPDTCSLHVDLEDGRVVRIDGNPEHPVTKGAICNKVRNLPDRIYHKDRLLYPMRRIRPKGSDSPDNPFASFERISWEEAYEEITHRLHSTTQSHGAQAILPYSFYGNMGILNAEGMDRRFWHRLGATKLDRAICNAAGAAGYTYTMGAGAGIDPEDTIHSKLIIAWGCNLISTNMHQVMYANEARKRGAKIIHIDVHRNRTSTWADQFIAVRPGTDGALALGLMHVLMKEDLIHHEFVAQYTQGYEELLAEAEQYNPERVSDITGVPAADIIELARLYGSTTPSYIRIGNGLQHHDNGGMTIRAIACLPALTGQWGVRGGGAMKGNGWYSSLNTLKLERPDLLPDPDVRTVNMNQLGDALLDEQSPVKLIFVYNSNPAIVAPDQNKVREGFMRDDLYTVVHDLFLTDTCRYADLVLPATSHLENMDLFSSYWHLYMQLHVPVLEPMGECKSNFTLFKELGLRMGFEPEVFGITEEQMIREGLDTDNPYLEGVTFERLLEEGWVKLKVDGSAFPYHIPTPSGKIELHSPAMQEAGLSPVPEYVPIQDEEAEAGLSVIGGLPFTLITGPNHSFINSTFGNIDRLKKIEKQPLLDMHTVDAAALGLETGDRVRVYNARGEVEMAVRAADHVLPGVLVSQGLWWENGNDGMQSVNALTSQKLSDMGGGATFFSARVALRKVEG